MTKESFDSQSLDEYFRSKAVLIEHALDQYLPKPSQHLALIHEAMRYSVLNGGKRIRPLLCLAVCDMLGGDEREALFAACSVELIHSYSLIHDDLPCLDNDEFRRGKWSCHKRFGEAIALLAGDALLTLGFHLLGRLEDSPKAQRILIELSQAAGTSGMVGGQVMDMRSGDEEVDLTMLDAIHIQKTGQLIKASCLAGAVIAGANPEDENHILKYGEYLGFAFQIIDDILDGDGYLRFVSAHEAREKAEEIITKAKDELSLFQKNLRLKQIADFILKRGSGES